MIEYKKDTPFVHYGETGETPKKFKVVTYKARGNSVTPYKEMTFSEIYYAVKINSMTGKLIFVNGLAYTIFYNPFSGGELTATNSLLNVGAQIYGETMIAGTNKKGDFRTITAADIKNLDGNIRAGTLIYSSL